MPPSPPSPQSRDSGSSLRLVVKGLLAAALAVGAYVWLSPKDTSNAVGTRAALDGGDKAAVVPSASAHEPRESEQPREAPTRPVAQGAITTLAWGRGPGEIGRSSGEGHGPQSRRMTVDSDGNTLFLDSENGRIVRVRADGGTDDVRLPTKDTIDLATTKDGKLALLARGEGEARVSFTDAAGRAGKDLALPTDIGRRAKNVRVVGSEVYVGTRSGEHHRVGTTSGGAGPQPELVPGAPMRDGKGYVTAILPSPQATDVHVFVIDRASGAQRWSRLVRPRLAVSGIVLADSDDQGDVYLLVTGTPREGSSEVAASAELVCLEGERGEVVGNVPIAVQLGPETIAAAHVLDGGGVLVTTSSPSGLRVERHDCR